MLGVEALIVFAVASFHFAVVPRRICTDLLVYYSVYAKYSLEQCRIRLSAFVVPEVFGELLPIVRLHTFNRGLKVLNRMRSRGISRQNSSSGKMIAEQAKAFVHERDHRRVGVRAVDGQAAILTQEKGKRV